MNPYDISSKYNLLHPLGSSGLGSSTDSFSLAEKYGLSHPLQEGSDLESQFTALDKNITNYSTRLESAGQEVPEPKKPQNTFLKVLSYLDRPRAAIWNGIHDAVAEDKPITQGMWEGLTGKDNYTGSQLMGDLGIENGIAKGVLGFVADVLGDPLSYATLGIGSAAKGALTGGAKLGAEGAEMLAKAALKDVTPKGAEQLGMLGLKASGEQVTKEAIAKATKDAAVGQLDNTLSKFGLAMDHPDKFASIEDAMSHAHSILSDSILKSAELAKKNTRGISFGLGKANVSLVSGETMEKVGAKLRDVPLLGAGLKAAGEIGSRIFNPKYIHGLDTAGREVAYTIKRDAMGTKNLADTTMTNRFNEYAATLGKLGEKEAAKQDALIRRVIEGAEDISVVRPELHNIVKDMKDDFMKWGAKEEDIGALKNMFDENYFPRIKNWDSTEKIVKGGMTEKLKIVNPSGFARKYNMQTAELANAVMKFKTSAIPAKEEFGLALEKRLRTDANAIAELRDNTELIKLLDNLAKNPTSEGLISEAINSGLKTKIISEGAVLDLVKQSTLDGVDNFFETSAVKGWISRGLRHNQIIADDSFLKGTLNAFGNKITSSEAARKAVEDGYTVVVPKSSLDLFRIKIDQDIKLKQGLNSIGREANATVNQVVGEGTELTRMSDELAKVVKTMIDDTPEGFKRVTPEQLDVLERYGGTALFGRQNLIEAYAVPNGVADSLRAAVARQTDAGKEALGDIIDNFYRLWKPTVTGLRPDYHIRNFMGNTLNNMLNVGFKALNPGLQKQAIMLMGKSGEPVVLAGQKISAKEIREAMLQHHATTNLQANEFDNLNKTLNAQFKGATEGIVKNTVKHPFETAARVGGAVGRTVESQGRTVNFLANVEDALERGLSKEEAYRYAGEQTNKYLFDYSELTKVEKDVFRRVMPFYTWMRKNVPLQLENFLDRPGLYSKFYQFKQDMEQANGIDSSNMPAWMQGDLAIPLSGEGADGKVPYLDISPPQADLARFNDPLKSLMTMLSPLAKVPIETYMNQSMLTGAPIYKNEYEKNQKILQNILGQFGILRDIGNAKAALSGNENDARTVSNVDLPGILSSGLLKNYDPAYGAKDTAYQYNRELGNLIQYLNDKGTFIPSSTRDAKEYANMSDSEKAAFAAQDQSKTKSKGMLDSNDILRQVYKQLGITKDPASKAINKVKKSFEKKIIGVTDYKNGGL